MNDPYKTVCDGCPPKCLECSFGEGQGSPTCMTLSEAGVEHATSKGGYTTIEELVIHKGYWRATNTSTNILRCFNTKACKGGLTGASDYCSRGYEGPCERSEQYHSKAIILEAAVSFGIYRLKCPSRCSFRHFRGVLKWKEHRFRQPQCVRSFSFDDIPFKSNTTSRALLISGVLRDHILRREWGQEN